VSGKLNIAVVGATGLIGAEIVELLQGREFPLGNIRLLATGPGVGEVVQVNGNPVPIREPAADSFAGVDIAFICVGGDSARELSFSAAAAGAVCIDTSSAWRSDPEVPLVVAAVNPEEIAGYGRRRVIATPGASTIMLATALKPLHAAAVVKRAVVSLFLSVSATGKKGIDELQKQVVALLNGLQTEPSVYPHQVAFNALPQVGAFGEGGYTDEETRLAEETSRVFGAQIGVTATAVRIPVFYGHSLSVNLETEAKLSATQASEVLAGGTGVEVIDDPVEGEYPMPADAAGNDGVFVGRIREDATVAGGLNLWIVADNVRERAANAVRIAEILAETYL
jgi:aspartate-semialdehyde dehydrogenase